MLVGAVQRSFVKRTRATNECNARADEIKQRRQLYRCVHQSLVQQCNGDSCQQLCRFEVFSRSDGRGSIQDRLERAVVTMWG